MVVPARTMCPNEVGTILGMRTLDQKKRKNSFLHVMSLFDVVLKRFPRESQSFGGMHMFFSEKFLWNSLYSVGCCCDSVARLYERICYSSYSRK